MVLRHMFLSLYDEVTNVLCVSLLSHDRYQYDLGERVECLTNEFQRFLVVVSHNFYLCINNQFLKISFSSRR